MAKKSEYDYIFPSVLIRSKETSLLKRADMEKVMEQKDVQGAMKVLSEFGYGDGKDSEDERAFEKALDAGLAESYELVFSVLSDEPQMKLFLYPNDYHNVKVLLKAEALKTDPAPLLLESAAIPPQEMQEMIRKRDFALLSVSMKQAITEAAELFAKSRDPQEIDIILDRACYRDMLEEAEKLDNAFVTGYVKLLIDSLNMSAFIRLRKIGKSKNFFEKIFLTGGNLEERFFEGAYEEAYSSIADKLQPFGYYEVFAEGAKAVTEKGSYSELEKILDNLKIRFAAECKYQPFGLETAAAYLIAKEMEVKNLRIIFAGKIAGTAAEIVAERLRETYV